MSEKSENEPQICVSQPKITMRRQQVSDRKINHLVGVYCLGDRPIDHLKRQTAVHSVVTNLTQRQ